MASCHDDDENMGNEIDGDPGGGKTEFIQTADAIKSAGMPGMPAKRIRLSGNVQDTPNSTNNITLSNRFGTLNDNTPEHEVIRTNVNN